MSRAWMPLYIADYLADTRRLTTLEHGAYLLLIMDYWRNGNLPSEDEQLARISGLSKKEWASAKTNISPLFQDGWRHKRIDKELAKANSVSSKRSNVAIERWDKQDAIAQANAPPIASANGHANGMHRARVPQSQPQPQREESASRSSSEGEDPKAKRRQKSESDQHLLDRITDLWNAWAAHRGSPQVERLTVGRATHCRHIVADLMQHGYETPEVAFQWLLGICDESFFVKGAPRKRLEFDQLMRESFVARMVEGSFKFQPQPAGARH